MRRAAVLAILSAFARAQLGGRSPWGGGRNTDAVALKALFTATGGSGWTAAASKGWATGSMTESPCTWAGVQCADRHRVSGLKLSKGASRAPPQPTVAPPPSTSPRSTHRPSEMCAHIAPSRRSTRARLPTRRAQQICKASFRTMSGVPCPRFGHSRTSTSVETRSSEVRHGMHALQCPARRRALLRPCDLARMHRAGSLPEDFARTHLRTATTIDLSDSQIGGSLPRSLESNTVLTTCAREPAHACPPTPEPTRSGPSQSGTRRHTNEWLHHNEDVRRVERLAD